MYEILKVLHVLGWSAWFGTAIAEASLGAQVRRATGEAGGRPALARTWARVGRIQLGSMALAILFGLALFAYELSMNPAGPAAFMRDPTRVYVHIMLALGLVAGVFTLLAGRARGTAVAAVEGGGTETFATPYKRAAMFSGMASLCLFAIILVVYLRTL